MLSPERPDRIQIAFDDHRLVANAGLLLPVTLAQRLGFGELVDRHVDLGRAPGRANTGDKMLTLVASALAGGGCIDDADVLRTGGTAGAIGRAVKAPSTLWLAGRRPSVWASNWQPPRPSGGASSLSPDGSPARRAASRYIFQSVGPGKTNSAAPLPDCAPCHSIPDGVRPVRWTTEPPGRFAPGRSLSVSCCTLAADLARRRRCGPSISPRHDCHTLQPARSIGARALHSPSSASHLSSDRLATSLRWIRG